MKKGILIIALLGAFLFVVYQALMYYDNHFPYGRMRETPAVKPYEEPMLIMEAGTVPFSGGEAVFRATDDDKLRSPLVNIDAAVLANGKMGYFTFCYQCHGPAYDGKGTVGQSFAPLPTDLQSPRIQNAAEGYLFKHISYGGGRAPALATTITVERRWEIVAFIKSLGIRK
jgi:mono/diheme cytochrome c family protein